MRLADLEALKAQAAARALELVKPGMVLGLGTGTTARYFIEGVGKLVSDGLRVRVVATSNASASLATALGMVVEDDVNGPIDLAVDGADEIDPEMHIIKGRGGALVREKLVAAAAEQYVIIADGSKLVERLGEGPLPVEVLPFLWRRTRDRLAALGATCSLRGGEEAPFRSDNGNMIVDLTFPVPFADPAALAKDLKQTLGVVDHGIFVGLANTCIVATEDGIETLGGIQWR
jgi:ribose 5-phosphate isomerase A